MEYCSRDIDSNIGGSAVAKIIVTRNSQFTLMCIVTQLKSDSRGYSDQTHEFTFLSLSIAFQYKIKSDLQ